VCSVSVREERALALTEDGQVYAWAETLHRAQSQSGSLPVERELLPRLVEALRGVRVSGIASDIASSWAVAGDGEVWQWRDNGTVSASAEDGEELARTLLEPREANWGVKVVALFPSDFHLLAL
jgi:alpha-tubulin suppressor-like RCC1 family protein